MPKRLATIGNRQPRALPPPPPKPKPPPLWPVRSSKLSLSGPPPSRMLAPPVVAQCSAAVTVAITRAAAIAAAMILQGKTALVTGSTSGIGLAIAKALVTEGAKLMINGFGDAADIERECSELGALHDGADMAKPAELERMMKRCADELGGPDIL